MPYYLINGLTQSAYTQSKREDFDEQGWLDHLQGCPVKIYIHTQLEAELTDKGLADGDPLPEDCFVLAAMPVRSEDYTQS